MSTNPTLKNEQLSTYLATDDSVRALEKAVENGQTRLALQVVLDLVSELTERLMNLEDIVNPSDEQLDEQISYDQSNSIDHSLAQEKPTIDVDKNDDKNDSVSTEKVEQAKVKSEETKVSK